MALTVSNVVLPGPVKIYVGPASTTAPTSSIAKGTAWGGSWVEVGFTAGGAMLKLGTEKAEAVMDQYNAPVKDIITQQSIELNFVAGEGTLTNLKQALGYGTVTSGSTESTFGVAGTEVLGTNYAYGVEVYAPGATSSNSWYQRYIIWIGSSQEVGDVELKKDGIMGIQYNVKGIIDTTQTSTEQLWKRIDRVV